MEWSTVSNALLKYENTPSTIFPSSNALSISSCYRGIIDRLIDWTENCVHFLIGIDCSCHNIWFDFLKVIGKPSVQNRPGQKAPSLAGIGH